MKLIWVYNIISLNIGIDLAEQQELERLFIHSGPILNTYLHVPGSIPDSGYRKSYGQVGDRQTGK